MVSLESPISTVDVRSMQKGGKIEIDRAITRLSEWLERNDYSGYDTFDGLSARFVRPLTFENKFLRIALQQGVRRFPINLRPLLGVRKSHSTKAMGFLARGFIRLHQATGDNAWGEKAKFALQWLIDNQSPGYSGACWGNHFDYQSRSSFVKKNTPSVVWTSLIGHAFLDAYDHFHEPRYLEIAVSACTHILSDLNQMPDGDSICIGYFPSQNLRVHNANTLGASLLARTYSYTRNESYRALAAKAIQYTAQYQRPDASWYYGEASNLHWVDNFHTAYVLDCFKYYGEGTGDDHFEGNLTRGYEYWKSTFFLPDGTPKYYDYKVLPIDIQCCSQAIDTLVFFQDRDPQSIELAVRVAMWTVEHMQDRTGYFYYRRYSPWVVNKTATLHWGQATMLSALAGLYKILVRTGRGLLRLNSAVVDKAILCMQVQNTTWNPLKHIAGRRFSCCLRTIPFPWDRRMRNLANALAGAGYELSVICPKGMGQDRASFEVVNGIKVYRYPMLYQASAGIGYLIEYAWGFLCAAVLSLVILVSDGFDIIHSANPPDMFFLLAWPYKLIGKKYVFDQHDLCPELYESKFEKRGFIHKLLLWFEKRSFRCGDLVISTNQSYRDIAVERGGVPANQVAIVRNGVDANYFHRVSPRVELKENFPYMALYLGVMGKQDGVDRVVQAAHHVVHTYGRRDILFVMVGRGEAWQDLQNLAKKLDVQDVFRFVGRISDELLLQYLSTADVCLAPDPPDRMNQLSTMTKILEYMAFQQPIVSFDLLESRRSAGDAAIYVEKDDPKLFAEAIIQILGDPVKRRHMGKIGAERTRDLIGWDKSRYALLEAYSRIGGIIPPPPPVTSLEVRENLQEHVS